MAVLELTRADVRTSAGLGHSLQCNRRTESVAACTCAVRDPDWQAVCGTGSQGPAQLRRKRNESTYSSSSSTAP